VHEQDAAEHHRRAAAIGQRTQRQQRGDVHDLREHEQPRDAGPVESELATAARRNGELLDGRVAHADRGAGRHRQSGQEPARPRRPAALARLGAVGVAPVRLSRTMRRRAGMPLVLIVTDHLTRRCPCPRKA